MAAIPRPSAELVDLLRAQQASESLEARVSDLAESDYWESANSALMGKQRRIAARNMRLLMSVLEVQRADSPEAALDLVEIALEVFTPAGNGDEGGAEREAPERLRVDVVGCPIQETPDAMPFCGTDVCPYWHHRRGWLDALGVRAHDVWLPPKEWRHGSCATIIVIDHAG